MLQRIRHLCSKCSYLYSIILLLCSVLEFCFLIIFCSIVQHLYLKQSSLSNIPTTLSSSSSFCLPFLCRRILSPLRGSCDGGGIESLIDPDSYAGWSFYTPGRAYQVRQVEGSFHSSYSHSFFYLPTLYFSTLCFSHSYITCLRC